MIKYIGTKVGVPLALLLLLSACGQRVEVPPAHVGKILTKSGFQPEVVPPSKFRLEKCWAYCDRLVLVEVSDQSFKQTMQLFMPKDELNISFDIRGQASISDNPENIHRIFDKIVPPDGGVVRFDQVFTTYAENRIRTVARSHMAKYTIVSRLRRSSPTVKRSGRSYPKPSNQRSSARRLISALLIWRTFNTPRSSLMQR